MSDLLELERQFDAAMMRTYQEAKRLYNYNATYFLQMLYEYRGVETARRLLASAVPGEGLAKLYEYDALQLSVEAQVLRPEFAPLFTDEEREVARQRLEEYWYSSS